MERTATVVLRDALVKLRSMFRIRANPEYEQAAKDFDARNEHKTEQLTAGYNYRAFLFHVNQASKRLRDFLQILNIHDRVLEGQYGQMAMDDDPKFERGKKRPTTRSGRKYHVVANLYLKYYENCVALAKVILQGHQKGIFNGEIKTLEEVSDIIFYTIFDPEHSLKNDHDKNKAAGKAN